MISNLHYIVQTKTMYYLLIKSYPCTIVFISELGLRCNDQKQTTVLFAWQISISCQ